MNDEAKELTTKALASAQAGIAALENWTIETDQQRDTAAEMCQDVKRRIKELEASRKTITQPLNAGLKAVNDLYRKPRKALEKCEQLFKRRMADYQLRQEAEKAESLKALANAETAEAAEAIIQELPAAQPAKGVNIRKTFKPRVTNVNMLPAEFTRLVPDEDKLKEHAKKLGKGGYPAPLPGVLFEMVEVVSVRT